MPGLPFNLEDLISLRSIEGNRVEFKSTWNKQIKADVIRTICAFANDLLNMNGGYIILGVEEEGGRPILPPRGLDDLDLDKIQRVLTSECRSKISPEYVPMLFPEVYQDKWILIVWAPGGDNRPYQAPSRKDEKTRVYHVRQGSQTVKARDDLLRQLLEQAAKIPFDDRRSHEARIEDLSPALVRRFLVDVRSDLAGTAQPVPEDDLYRRLRITVRVNSREVPRNVGLLFFSDDPDRFFRGARIEIAHFSDDAGGNLIEEKVIRGPIQDQVKMTVQHLQSLVDIVIRKVPGRAEVERTVAFPYEAMEEAIVNAVYHRSYEHSVEPTKVFLYPSCMKITSYPGPVQGIEKSHFLRDASFPQVPCRNRRIGEFLKELRLAEMRYTGIAKIRRKMEENGSPEPVFEFDEGRTYFTVILPAHPGYSVINAIRQSAYLWAVGEHADAVAHLERALKEQPQSGALAAQLIEYLGKMDELKRAELALEAFRAQPLRSQELLPYLRMTSALFDHGQEKAAHRIIKLMPKAVGSEDRAETAILLKRAGKHKEAHRLFHESYESMKDDAKFVHEFAQTKLTLAKNRQMTRASRRQLCREAAELLRRAIQLSEDPIRQAWCWSHLAQALSQLRKPASEVEEAYARAIELRPDEPRFKEWYDRWRARKQKR